MNNHERQKVPLGYVNKLRHYSLGHGLAKCSPWAKFGPHLFFLAALGLHCCTQVFSSCGKQGLLSSCGAQASHCNGVSCRRAGALGHADFSSCASQALKFGLSKYKDLVAHGMWNFPRPGIKPMSPALAEGF